MVNYNLYMLDRQYIIYYITCLCNAISLTTQLHPVKCWVFSHYFPKLLLELLCLIVGLKGCDICLFNIDNLVYKDEGSGATSIVTSVPF